MAIRWFVALGMAVAFDEMRAEDPRFQVRVDVFDATAAGLALATTTFEVSENVEGEGQFTVDDRRIEVRALLGRPGPLPDCRPLNLVVRESRELPDRWREVKAKTRVCANEPATVQPDPQTKMVIAVSGPH